MPFAQITQHTNQRAIRLENQLAQEWQNPEGDAAEPIIIEESESQHVPDHLYVIWSEWADLSQYERSKIILSAYEIVRGRPYALNVTVAMGLTAEEADRMGIEYSTVE